MVTSSSRCSLVSSIVNDSPETSIRLPSVYECRIKIVDATSQEHTSSRPSVIIRTDFEVGLVQHIHIQCDGTFRWTIDPLPWSWYGDEMFTIHTGNRKTHNAQNDSDGKYDFMRNLSVCYPACLTGYNLPVEFRGLGAKLAIWAKEWLERRVTWCMDGRMTGSVFIRRKYVQNISTILPRQHPRQKRRRTDGEDKREKRISGPPTQLKPAETSKRKAGTKTSTK